MHARAQSAKNPEKSAIFKEAAIAIKRLKAGQKIKKVQAKKLVKSYKSKKFFREIPFLAVFKHFPSSKIDFWPFLK